MLACASQVLRPLEAVTVLASIFVVLGLTIWFLSWWRRRRLHAATAAVAAARSAAEACGRAAEAASGGALVLVLLSTELTQPTLPSGRPSAPVVPTGMLPTPSPAGPREEGPKSAPATGAATDTPACAAAGPGGTLLATALSLEEFGRRAAGSTHWPVLFPADKTGAEECPVCFRGDSRALVALPCRHPLCAACTSRVGACPLCRGSLFFK